jgi:hypothetical protein
LTAREAGYDEVGGEASQSRGSTGIPVASATSSHAEICSTAGPNSRAKPPITGSIDSRSPSSTASRRSAGSIPQDSGEAGSV